MRPGHASGRNGGRGPYNAPTFLRLPHPIVLLGAAVLAAAALTWILPAGQFDRRDDAATARRVVVPGTYHTVPRAPVGPFAAIVAIPRGFVAAADVVGVILFVGGAWVVVDRLGTLPAVVDALALAFAGRALWAIPIVSLFFAAMGALENMQEEIIPLVPALLVLGAGLGIDAVTVVAMSAGAAMVGSAFGPTNPFQAGIALKLSELPPLAGAGMRAVMLVGAIAIWIGWTLRYAHRARLSSAQGARSPASERRVADRAGARAAADTDRPPHALILTLMLMPMAVYVYGALRLDWGFGELSAAFIIGGVLAGLVGGLGMGGTITAYLAGMQTLLPAAVIVGVARSISLVLEDGRIVDTLLFGMVTLLGRTPGVTAALLMIPFQALLHIAVPSVSGQAVLTMPLFAPLADVLGLSRQLPVLAYQTGAGLMELATPTNGALMAILLAANVPFARWIRFVWPALVALTLLGGVMMLVPGS